MLILETDNFEKLRQKIAEARGVASDRALLKRDPTMQDISNEAGIGSLKTDIKDAKNGGRASLVVKLKCKSILKVLFSDGCHLSV